MHLIAAKDMCHLVPCILLFQGQQSAHTLLLILYATRVDTVVVAGVNTVVVAGVNTTLNTASDIAHACRSTALPSLQVAGPALSHIASFCYNIT